MRAYVRHKERKQHIVSPELDDIVMDWQNSERYAMEYDIFGGDPNEFIRYSAGFYGYGYVRHWVML